MVKIGHSVSVCNARGTRLADFFTDAFTGILDLPSGRHNASTGHLHNHCVRNFILNRRIFVVFSSGRRSNRDIQKKKPYRGLSGIFEESIKFKRLSACHGGSRPRRRRVGRWRFAPGIALQLPKTV